MKKHKKNIIIIAFLAILAAVITAFIVLIIIYKQNEYRLEGTIDCQPPLSEYEAERCRRAEEANYPNIVY